MRYQMIVAATGLMMLSACDDPKPTAADAGRPVSAPSATAGSSAGQGTVATETPGNTMMMQSGGNGGSAQTMNQGTAMQGGMQQQTPLTPRGEPAAGNQPGPTQSTGTAQGDTAPGR